MAKLLFNITNGTNNPTKASLGFMLARTAVEEGHEVQDREGRAQARAHREEDEGARNVRQEGAAVAPG